MVQGYYTSSHGCFLNNAHFIWCTICIRVLHYILNSVGFLILQPQTWIRISTAVSLPGCFSSFSSPPANRRQQDHRPFVGIQVSLRHSRHFNASTCQPPYIKHNYVNQWNSATNKLLYIIVYFTATRFHNMPRRSDSFLSAYWKVKIYHVSVLYPLFLIWVKKSCVW